jgi:glutaminase
LACGQFKRGGDEDEQCGQQPQDTGWPVPVADGRVDGVDGAATAADLAVMGATLADGGVNPLTGARVVQQAICHYALAVMATAGMYETSGDWLYDVGVPGKSGIGGGIVAVSPGKGAPGTFAPLLDDAGNSVKGQRVAKFLSQRLGLSLFTSTTDD